MNNPNIAARFSDYDSDRAIYLRRCRALARVTDYTLLPPEKETKASEQYVRQYQSLGPQAVNLAESQFFFSCYTPGLPWFATPISYEVLYNPEVPDEDKIAAQELAMMRDLGLAAAMEQTSHHGALGFYEGQRQLIRSVVVFGSGLQKLYSDQTCQNFRLDQFVTRRDCKGTPVEHVTRECIDPMTLTDVQLEAVGLDRKTLSEQTRRQRECDLYTHCEYDSQKDEWVTTQEVNSRQLQDSFREKISRYIAPAIRLSAGDHYGVGIFSPYLADFAAMDELGLRLLQIAQIAANCKWAVNHGSPTDPEHLKWAPGSVIRATVTGGGVQDVAALYAQVGQSAAIVENTVARTSQNVAQALGIVAASLPNVDRVTALQVERVTQQIEQYSGGALSSFQSTAQAHQIEVVKHDIDHLLPKIPSQWKKYISTKVVTGVASAVRQIKASRLASAMQLAAQFGPEFMQEINPARVMGAMFRYENVWEPGMFKTPEQKQAEAQAAAQLEVQTQSGIAGGKEAARVAGAALQQQVAPQQ